MLLIEKMKTAQIKISYITILAFTEKNVLEFFESVIYKLNNIF